MYWSLNLGRCRKWREGEKGHGSIARVVDVVADADDADADDDGSYGAIDR
jgi:hypothetical protein